MYQIPLAAEDIHNLQLRRWKEYGITFLCSFIYFITFLKLEYSFLFKIDQQSFLLGLWYTNLDFKNISTIAKKIISQQKKILALAFLVLFSVIYYIFHQSFRGALYTFFRKSILRSFPSSFLFRFRIEIRAQFFLKENVVFYFQNHHQQKKCSSFQVKKS